MAVSRASSDCLGCINRHCIPRSLRPLFIYLRVSRFRNTLPVSCDEVFWNVLCGFHSIIFCDISVPTDCVFFPVGVSTWSTMRSTTYLFFRESFYRHFCCFRHHGIVSPVSNRLQLQLLSIGLCIAGWFWDPRWFCGGSFNTIYRYRIWYTVFGNGDGTRFKRKTFVNACRIW